MRECGGGRGMREGEGREGGKRSEGGVREGEGREGGRGSEGERVKK